MGFFTTSITDDSLLKLQIEVSKIIIDCQKKLDSIAGKKAETQKYEILKQQIFNTYACQIEKSLQEFRE